MLAGCGISSRLETLSNDPIEAVRETLRKMVAIARKYSADLTTINAATIIITNSGIEDTRRQRYQCIKAIQNWVRDQINYASDPLYTEMIQTPPATLNRGWGDCDDKAILVATLLTTLGFECEFLAVGGTGPEWDSSPIDENGFYDPSAIPDYSHVLAACRHGPRNGRRPSFLDGWLALETIVPAAGPGWFPSGTRVIMPARI